MHDTSTLTRAPAIALSQVNLSLGRGAARVHILKDIGLNIGHGEAVGLVELMELNTIHRRGEFQIIIAPGWQGRGYASTATRLAIDYAFMVLNLHKLYLVVDVKNEKAVHIYEKCGFQREGELIEEFFSNGAYHNALRMCAFQRDYVAQAAAPNR